MSFWKEWHDNIGKISEKENNEFYMLQYYHYVLTHLNSSDILNELLNDTILLCYENSESFCHRHIVSTWLETELGIVVPEVKVDEFGDIQILERPKEIETFMKKLILK